MKLNYKRTMLIGLAFMSIMAFSQMYDNIIPLILKNSYVILKRKNLRGSFMKKIFIPFRRRL